MDKHVCYYLIREVALVGFAPTWPSSRPTPDRMCLLFHHSATIPLPWLVMKTSCAYTGCVGVVDAHRSSKRPATEAVFSYSKCPNRFHSYVSSTHQIQPNQQVYYSSFQLEKNELRAYRICF